MIFSPLPIHSADTNFPFYYNCQANPYQQWPVEPPRTEAHKAPETLQLAQDESPPGEYQNVQLQDSGPPRPPPLFTDLTPPSPLEVYPNMVPLPGKDFVHFFYFL